MNGTTAVLVSCGIEAVDERVGGLQEGGTYLVIGAPGPEKLVAALQFVHAGTEAGDPTALLTNAGAEGILDVAEAWGFDLREAWETGLLQIVGFKEDFELRAIRSIAPEEVLEELDTVVRQDRTRIAVVFLFITLVSSISAIDAAIDIGGQDRHRIESLFVC